MVRDAAGYTLVAGTFADTAQFGATSLQSAGGSDVFVGKLDGAGQWVWVVRGGGEEDDFVGGLALTPAGGVVLTGSVGSLAAFGSGQVTASAQSRAAFVAQLDASGQWQWVTGSTVPGGSLDSEVVGNGVACDAAGNVYVVGAMQGQAGTAQLGSSGFPLDTLCQGFLAKLDPAGQWQWARPTSANSKLTHVAVDASGGLFTAGIANEPDTLYGTTETIPHAFISAHDLATGLRQWNQADTSHYYVFVTPGNFSPGGCGPAVPCSITSSYSRIGGLVSDGNGRVFVAGEYDGEAALAGAALGPAAFRAGVGNFFVMALDASTGARQWKANALTRTIESRVNALTVSAAGNPTLVGWGVYIGPPCGSSPGGGSPPVDLMEGTILFGSDTLWVSGSGYVAQLDASTGQWSWVVSTEGELTTVAAGSAGELVVGGGNFYAPSFDLLGLTYSSGQYALVAQLFENGPYLRAMSAYEGHVGQVITLRGAHFTPTTDVRFGGVAAAFTVATDNTIRATVPAGFSAGLVMVVSPDGTSVSSNEFRIGSPLGLQEDPATASLVVWPNPARAAVRVTVGDSPADVELCDVLGRMMARVAGARGIVTLPLAGLPAGTYVVRVGPRVARLVVE